jgi:hypothetical protein
MYLPNISKSVRSLLEDFSIKELANYPNLYGVYTQSEIVLDISEGEANNDSISDEIINLTLKISIATAKSTNEKTEYTEADRDLETIISLIIKRVRKAVLPGTRRISFQKFQKFTPESGKHRALLTFNIPAYITDFENGGVENDNRIKEIKIRYT